jgi:hypothetical protein
MSAQPDLSKLSVGQFAERFRGEMIALSNTFSYFCATAPLSEEDLKEYLQEPIASLPPSISSALPKVSLMLVPYLERGGGDFVCTEKPPENRLSWASQLRLDKEEVLLFALQGQEVAEYHYRLYHLLARFMGDLWSSAARDRYSALIREELIARAHGEVDEESWRLKQELLRRQNSFRKDTKLFRDYVRQSFVDTLTLYLHGICCDIDVETGPRQLRSRYLRNRLNLLHELYPPPKGYVVFPEQTS